MHAAADYEPGAMKKEPRTNRNVTTTTSSADLQRVKTHPQEDGLGVRNQVSHSNDTHLSA